MWSGLNEDVIIAKIKSSASNLDTSPSALKELKAAHVPKKVVLAMLQATAVASPSSAQVAAASLAGTRAGRIQNVAPEEMWNRVTQCVLPTYSALALNSHITGTVDIGLGISPEGEVGISSRVLGGPALLVPSAMTAVNQWKFRPNIVQGEVTWSRVRALVRFNADGTTVVDLAPGILADNFGDPGTPSSTAVAVARPASAPECKSVNEPAQAPKTNQQPASVPAAAGDPEGSVPKTSAAGALSAETLSRPGDPSQGASPDSGPKFVDGAYMPGVGGIGQPSCVRCPQPSYSNKARDAKISGTVALHLLITPEGRAANIQVRRPLGYGLDENAVEAVRDWQFKPAADAEGKPVPVWADIEVSFRIR
jgi:TonB family protein